MRFALLLLASTTLVASPVLANDGNIPQGTLSALGLESLQVMSDADGMEIRGQSSAFAMVIGTSTIFGQLVTPDTKNFVVASDVNMVRGNAETTDALSPATAYKNHNSFLDLDLDVDFVGLPADFNYSGSINGIVGGNGIAQGATFANFVLPLP